MHEYPSGKVREVHGIELQRRQVQPPFLRVSVVALDAIVFDELENCQGHVTGHYRSGDSQEQAEPGEYSHAVETSRVHKALYHSNPCSAQSQRNGEAVVRRFISANEWLNPVLVECASGFGYNVCRVRRKFSAKLS